MALVGERTPSLHQILAQLTMCSIVAGVVFGAFALGFVATVAGRALNSGDMVA